MSATAPTRTLRLAIAARVRAGIASGPPPLPAPVKVWPYEPYAAEPRRLQRYYATSQGLRGWSLRRLATNEIEDGTLYRTEVHRWRLVAVRALDEPREVDVQHPSAMLDASSELDFDAEIERVRDAFRADDVLYDEGGAPLIESMTWEGSAGLQLIESGPTMFAGVLCHLARLELVTVGSRTIGTDAVDDFLRMGLWVGERPVPQPDGPPEDAPLPQPARIPVHDMPT